MYYCMCVSVRDFQCIHIFKFIYLIYIDENLCVERMPFIYTYIMPIYERRIKIDLFILALGIKAVDLDCSNTFS